MSNLHSPIILAIESSCDDTGVAILSNGKVLANIVASQLEHEEYGGVVPEIASRAHLENIQPTINKALKTADVDKKSLNAIAVTIGPGLLGSLVVGVNFAKAFSFGLGIPLLAINHMEAHVGAHYIDEQPEFPFLCLTVSGGHTQIVLVRDYLDMEVIGETIDDAAGEAFDKTGKMLGLPYPSGPVIDKKAALGDPSFIQFAKPKMENYNYSFSGLKTSIMNNIRKAIQVNPSLLQDHINDICASVQSTIIEILMVKLIKASEDLNIKNIAIAGGVSANSGLRKKLMDLGNEKGWKVSIPKFQYCTDNAAMIGIIGHYQYLDKRFADLAIQPKPRLKLGTIL